MLTLQSLHFPIPRCDTPRYTASHSRYSWSCVRLRDASARPQAQKLGEYVAWQLRSAAQHSAAQRNHRPASLNGIQAVLFTVRLHHVY